MFAQAAEIITRFPCCRGISFAALTPAQESVIELACNLADDAMEFNLHHALQVWEDADLAAFWGVVKEAYKSL